MRYWEVGFSKFAGDAKLATSVGNLEDYIMVQHNLDKLLGFVDKWQMINSKKCKVLHVDCWKYDFSCDIN